MEVIIEATKFSAQYNGCPSESSCGYYAYDPDDGSCTVDLTDGCDCDSYSGAG